MHRSRTQNRSLPLSASRYRKAPRNSPTDRPVLDHHGPSRQKKDRNGRFEDRAWRRSRPFPIKASYKPLPIADNDTLFAIFWFEVQDSRIDKRIGCDRTRIGLTDPIMDQIFESRKTRIRKIQVGVDRLSRAPPLIG